VKFWNLNFVIYGHIPSGGEENEDNSMRTDSYAHRTISKEKLIPHILLTRNSKSLISCVCTSSIVYRFFFYCRTKKRKKREKKPGPATVFGPPAESEGRVCSLRCGSVPDGLCPAALGGSITRGCAAAGPGASDGDGASDGASAGASAAASAAAA
jgi:hypothetical protein